VNQQVRKLEKQGVKVIYNKIITQQDLSFYKLLPDVKVPEHIAWTHRTGDQGDVYFISNQENTERNIDITLRCQTSIPTRWNPVNGAISHIEHVEKNQYGTHFKLELAPYESTFIVFYSKDPVKYNIVKTLRRDSVSITGNWDINFLKNNQTMTGSALFDWSKHTNPLIKYYSGTAIYKTNFTWGYDPDKTSIDIVPVYLSVGKVCNMATIRVNGIDCGTAWTAPYQVEITRALKKGTNLLEIEVVNTWANAINGSDKGTPPFPGISTNGKYRLKENKLLESGLIGPVVIRTK